VSNVVGDGFNFGNGNLSNGLGPITLNNYVPSKVYLDPNQSTPTAIIPQFDNALDQAITTQVLDLINLQQSFALKYDNSVLSNGNRWTVVQPIPNSNTSSPTDYFITFAANTPANNYLVTIRSLTYYFASVNQVRFMFDGTQRVYDPASGQVFSDFVNIFATNANPAFTGTLGIDYPLNVTGQPTQSDGYPDDFEVTVSSINLNSNFTYDPDFFTNIVGTSPTAYVFLGVYYDVANLYRTQVLPQGQVIYAYTTQNAVTNVVYEYPVGTVFYCSQGSASSPTPKFYQSVQTVSGANFPIVTLNDVTTSYLVVTGRGGLNFQYAHNSNNTTRVDPSTTNIIDLFLVTQGYYNNYQNWIQDTTGTIAKPARPTIEQLQQAYGNLDSYKMISDSLVLNSVTFVPLFGTKASPALQGTIKIVSNPSTVASSSQIVSSCLSAMNQYFSITVWNFGDTFYMSELTAYLHVQLGSLISSVVLVPNNPNQTFGDLYEVQCQPNQIFVNGATANDIVVISGLTPYNLQQAPV
jgi:hypothetical protein